MGAKGTVGAADEGRDEKIPLALSGFRAGIALRVRFHWGAQGKDGGVHRQWRPAGLAAGPCPKAGAHLSAKKTPRNSHQPCKDFWCARPQRVRTRCAGNLGCDGGALVSSAGLQRPWLVSTRRLESSR